MPPLWERVRQRKLFQWAVAYLAGAWALLQVVDLIGGQFGWPVAAMRSATALLAVGFLVVLVLAWYHGERGHQRVTGVELMMLAALLEEASGSGRSFGVVSQLHSRAFDPIRSDPRFQAMMRRLGLEP